MSNTPKSKVAVFVGSSRPGSINRKFARALAKLGAAKLDFEVVEVDDLPGPLVSLHEPDLERLGLGDSAAQRHLEERGINRARDVQVPGDVVARVRRIELLGEPDARLSACEWQTNPPPINHWTSPWAG